MWYIFTMKYYLTIKRNKIGSFVVRWMNLEPVTQSEVNQKEKNKYCILTHIWNLEKWYWWTYLQGRNRVANIENRLVDAVGEGEDGMNWETGIDLYTHCVWNCCIYSLGDSVLCAVMTQRGGMGEIGGTLKGEGTDAYLQLINAVMQQKPTQHCKTIVLQWKNNKMKKKEYCAVFTSPRLKHCDREPPTHHQTCPRPGALLLLSPGVCFLETAESLAVPQSSVCNMSVKHLLQLYFLIG